MEKESRPKEDGYDIITKRGEGMKLDNEYSVLAPYIADDEIVLWRGKSEKLYLFSLFDIFMIPFSIVWCGFAVFCLVSLIMSDDSAPPVTYLALSLFVVVGMYMLFGRFIYAAYKIKRVIYVITNKRILRYCAKQINTIDGHDLPSMHIKINKDGSGSIRFGNEIVHRNGGGVYYANSSGYSDSRRVLFMIEKVPNIVFVMQKIGMMDK